MAQRFDRIQTRSPNRRIHELEVLDDGILVDNDRPWTPELGRIVYVVRDGEQAVLRQHRLSD